MNLDWDTILSYNTVKIVRIRDRRLGLLHLLFMVFIVSYVVVYQAIYKKGYLLSEVPVCSIRTTLMAPKEIDTERPYCKSNNNTYAYSKLECEYWDDPLVLFPPGDDVSFTASTRVKITNQTTDGCSFKDPRCKYKDVSEESIYVADIEKYTVMIDHTMFSPQSQIQYNARDLSGYILDRDGNEIQINDTNNRVGVKGQYDVLEIGKLLELGGIDLDAESPDKGDPNRYTGIIALVFIKYSNTFSYSTGNFKYTYSIRQVNDTIYNVKDPIYFDSLGSRMVLKRYGIRLLFVQDGAIGSFNFQSLLLTMVSGLGLLTVATLVVDQLAVRILPQRKSYSSVKFQVTESMSKKKKIIDDSGEELLYTKIEGL
ncbi:hypothetical protein DICPUDRAFT_74417 [Dictyostelium purpureum]|uniref:Purinergic receptor n=1 Tax=Dictyostelium purpureum TaxID=5786 RepID=F0Z7P1_DICPU|nr:uncharacterized protein DICPUDRAFT_74417 [Dictyostelium purpureum]EGC40099.1 hypothetical protein DICPUDRAFT_74417 [Dictyostelium purpureum]|eukprot:XP_003283448.1 hypothetical protein DICPUDRAFT_74417 [Dictyostelium purpureum]